MGSPLLVLTTEIHLAKDGFPPLEPNMITSWQVFSTAAEKYPGNRLLSWREFTNGKARPYKWKTYKQVYNEVLRIGSALLNLGAIPGSRIGIYGANCPQWIVAMEICNGYSLMCSSTRYIGTGPGAVDYIIEHAGIDFVFMQDKKVKQILNSDCTSSSLLKCMVSFTSITKEQSNVATNLSIKAYSWNEFLNMGKEFILDPIPQPLDICTIMYTSGTSGHPNGVILTHESHTTYVHGMDLYMEKF